ncbi:GNAT family N-acetyltransferase [Bacillus sp. 2205SS5-2]|uniref:GNAT family N-acetyltransferase n=1 Tax=Bacillus sp. 2205SS5-2 TaxID=3109031 RepID=UPI0030069000
MGQIRKGIPADMDRIMAIVQGTIHVMEENQNDQWTEEYPNQEVFRADIYKENLYVAINDQNEPVGMITVDQEQTPEYEYIDWQSNQEAYIFHRIAVDVKGRGEGIASNLIQHAEKIAVQEGVPYMRTDTYSKNKKAQALFEKNGYKKVGTIPTLFGKNQPFYAYDKILSK